MKKYSIAPHGDIR
jgi:hypothetical protein